MTKTERRQFLKIAAITAAAGIYTACQSPNESSTPEPTPNPYEPKTLHPGDEFSCTIFTAKNESGLKLTVNPQNFFLLFIEFLDANGLEITEGNPNNPHLVFTNQEAPLLPDLGYKNEAEITLSKEQPPQIQFNLGTELEIYQKNGASRSNLTLLSRMVSATVVYGLTELGIKKGVYTPTEAHRIVVNYVNSRYCIETRFLPVIVEGPDQTV